MVRRDALWKGILEDLSEDALRFFFPDYVDVIDFGKGFEYLDKELDKLFTPSKASARRVDKLIKVWLKNGEPHWFLLHIEVQGYRDLLFAKRMFQSVYRLQDKFQYPITAVVIYTDGNRKYHPSEYRESFMGSSLVYQFNTYELVDHSIEELAASSNIFAVVLEAAKAGIGRKQKDRKATGIKITLVKKLLERGYPPEKVRKVLNFIKHYVRFENNEEKTNFENELDKILQTRKNMGIEEAILDDVKQQGIEIGMRRGLKKGREEGREEGSLEKEKKVIANGIQQGLTIEVLAALTDLTVPAVEAIVKSLNTL